MQRIRSIHETAAIKSAIELGVFTKLGALCRRGRGGGKSTLGRTWAGATAGEVAKVCGCAERGMRVLLDALASGRFLRKIKSRTGVSSGWGLDSGVVEGNNGTATSIFVCCTCWHGANTCHLCRVVPCISTPPTVDGIH